MEEVREYERTMQEKTNCKVKSSQNAGEAANSFKKKKKQQEKKAHIVNKSRNPEKSEHLVCPPPSHRHPHFKIRHPSLQRR